MNKRQHKKHLKKFREEINEIIEIGESVLNDFDRINKEQENAIVRMGEPKLLKNQAL